MVLEKCEISAMRKDPRPYLNSRCLFGVCQMRAWCVLVCASYLLYVCFPPKLGSTRGPPLYAYGSSPSSCLLPKLVEPSCCLVTASTNQSAALAQLDQSVRWLKKMKEMKMNCHLLTTALLTRGRGKKIHQFLRLGDPEW